MPHQRSWNKGSNCSGTGMGSGHGEGPQSMGCGLLPVPAAPVHHPGVWCDGCDEPVVGVRWKCLTRRNFDLCDTCFSVPGIHSTPSDMWLHLPQPSSVNLHDVQPLEVGAADGDREGSPCEIEANWTAAASVATHEGVFCDWCDAALVGVRFKCGHCMDFDLCQGCYSSKVAGQHYHDERHMFIACPGEVPYWLESQLRAPELPDAAVAQAQLVQAASPATTAPLPGNGPTQLSVARAVWLSSSEMGELAALEEEAFGEDAWGIDELQRKVNCEGCGFIDVVRGVVQSSDGASVSSREEAEGQSSTCHTSIAAYSSYCFLAQSGSGHARLRRAMRKAFARISPQRWSAYSSGSSRYSSSVHYSYNTAARDNGYSHFGAPAWNNEYRWKPQLPSFTLKSASSGYGEGSGYDEGSYGEGNGYGSGGEDGFGSTGVDVTGAGPELVYISSFAVSRRWQRQGIGTSLMQHVLSAARNRPSCRGVALHVKANNAAAISLYRRSGFSTLAFLANHYGHGDHGYLMLAKVEQSASPQQHPSSAAVAMMKSHH